MRPLFALPVRATEATPDQLVTSGAVVGSWGRDPVDGDVGWQQVGAVGRQVPPWTLEKARAYSIAAYRINPMAKAIIDTYTAFCVGDSGVSLLVTSPQVQAVTDEFWNDPRNKLGDIQELMLRDQMLNGETALEMLQGSLSGVVRFSPFDPAWINYVTLLDNNPLWPSKITLGQNAAQQGRTMSVVMVDDATGLRDGECMFWTPWKALLTDRRGMPFLSAIVDQLDAYDTIISNLIDRTSLARYLVWDVTVEGDQTAVDNYVASQGGMLHVPPSGSVQVHNSGVTWEPKTAQTGAMEDSTAASTVLTEIAGGAGLSKHWLSEPDGANRATSHSMAEPVRRRVGGVQKVWLGYMTELARFAVDRAVAAKRLPPMVESVDPRTGLITDVPAAQTVVATGPEIAAADSQVTAQVLLNLSTGLGNFVKYGIMSAEAASIAAQKAWEQFVGVPYRQDLDSPSTNPDDLATYVDQNQPPAQTGTPLTAGLNNNAQGAAEAVKSVAGAEGAARLHEYWTKGEGLAKWAESPKPWTTLRAHLLKFMPAEKATRTASQWFHDVFGFWPGSDLNRVTHGEPPRGHVVGPG